MAKDDYIPVTGDDWYERRRNDAAGKFWLSVAQQGPMKDVATKQGIYMLTAGGKLLHSKNAGQNVEVMREALKQGLREWKRLPASERAPGAIKIEDLASVDKNFVRTPPLGGLIVDVYVRTLDKSETNSSGFCAACAQKTAGKMVDLESQRDHLWLTKTEVQSLAMKESKVGDTLPVPAGIANRISRFHLVDSTRGQPPMWKKNELLKGAMTLKVESIKDGKTELILDGAALLSTDPDTAKAERGYDAAISGKLVFNNTTDSFERFDLVVVGDYWGEGKFTPGARPGRTPLGVAFELSSPDDPSNAVPPEGAKNWWDYMNAK